MFEDQHTEISNLIGLYGTACYEYHSYFDRLSAYENENTLERLHTNVLTSKRNVLEFLRTNYSRKVKV